MIRALLLLVAILVAGLGWSLWRAERADSRATEAEAALAAVQAEARNLRTALDVERERVGRMSAIGDEHEQDREEAETVPAAVVADLRAGNLRLRREWAGCETARLSGTVAATVERDALAESREQLAGAVVRVGRDADDQLRACQAVIRADRGDQ